jgi:hypothetical protein
MIDVIQIPWSETGGPVFQRGFSGRDGEDEAISSRKRDRLEIVIAWLGPTAPAVWHRAIGAGPDMVTALAAARNVLSASAPPRKSRLICPRGKSVEFGSSRREQISG